MRPIKVAFANIFQGFIFHGKSDKKEHLFTGWHPSRHAKALAAFNPDICCIAEMVFTGENCPVVDTFKNMLGLPYATIVSTSDSWVLEGKTFGLAIFSRFPIIESRIAELPNPHLTVTRPNGYVWHTHDKVCQIAAVDVDGRHIQVINLQSFPFHHFNRRLDELEFLSFRQAFATLLLDKDKPSIVTGDFNNLGIPLPQAFPEFFTANGFTNAVEITRDILDKTGDPNQIDHILASHQFNVLDTYQEYKLSDHPTLAVTLSICDR